MTFLEKLDKFNRRLSSGFELIGLSGLLVMMTITCLDVFGGKLFRTPVYGALDIVMLSQLVAISFATAYALIIGRHVSVEFFMVLLPERLQALIETVISFFGLTFFVLIIWRLLVYGHSLQIGGEVSATIRIPLYPFAYGIAVASIPVALIFLTQILKAIARMVAK
ncbi:MAG: TRAP transporter small permease [Desulfobacterales bacterium]|jgi:TRAP-type C4-dicarboxylate transport system permease small subunit